ncbi:MAG: hypothetical protein KGJ13_12900, partial [Patescibacteria group bacterium]|nr:hypothetical protein [Patescibacteria group bacterium]
GAGRLIRLLPDGLLRNSHQKFCSQLGIAGLQEGILYPRAADSFNFSPSMLRGDANLDCKAMWIGRHGEFVA